MCLTASAEPAVVRPLQRDELDAAAETLAACFQEAFADLLAPPALAALSIDRARARLSDKEALSLVAATAGCLVGIGQLKGDWINLLYVRQSHHRQGIGDALMRRLMESGRRTGKDRLRLWCLHNNWQARRFYDRRGAPTGTSDIMAVGGQPLLHLEYEVRL